MTASRRLLGQQFLDEAGQDVGELRRILVHASGRPAGENARRFRKVVHNLRGAGGSYGFSRVSEAAARIEQDLAEGAAADALAAGLGELERALREAVVADDTSRATPARLLVLVGVEDRLRAALEWVGFALEDASSAGAARERLGVEPRPSGVVVRVDDTDALARLEGTVPVVAVGEDVHRRAAIEAGAWAFVSNRVGLDEVTRIVDETLRNA